MVTLPHRRGRGLEHAGRGVWRPPAVLVVVVATLATFWWSLASLLKYALAETTLGFAPLMPLLALAAAVLSVLRHYASPPVAREPFLDRLVGGGLVGVALWLVSRGLAGDDWYYWIERWDLLALVVWSFGIAVWVWGLGALKRHGWAAAYALLAWPVPFVRLQEWGGPFLAGVTALLARPIAEGIGVPLAAATAEFTRFVGESPDHPFVVLITSACSGSMAMLSVLAIGLLVLMFSRGDLPAKIGWLVTGLALALASNVLRVVILLAVSSAYGVEFGLGVVHPILGAALLLPLFFALWVLLAPFGIRPVPLAPVGQAVRGWLRPSTDRGRGTAALAQAALLAATLVGAIMDARLQVYSELIPDQIVAFNLDDPREYLPDLPGWTLEPDEEISWHNLFGPESRAQVFDYRSAETPWTVVQYVATRDRVSLSRYTPEQCGLFHGDEIVGSQRVDLGAGQTGYLVETDSWTEFGAGRLIRGSVLYWYAPVEVDGAIWHLRIALLLDTDAKLAPLPEEPAGVRGANPERLLVNQHLVRLARAIIAFNLQRVR